jgi:hypothetical protein
MKNNSLGAIEALLRNAHELLVGATCEAEADGDAVLQHELEQLAGLAAAKLANVRMRLNPKRRRA